MGSCPATGCQEKAMGGRRAAAVKLQEEGRTQEPGAGPEFKFPYLSLHTPEPVRTS